MKVDMRARSAGVLSAVGIAACSQAADIFIENFGFETDVLANGAYIIGAPTGWTSDGGIAGWFNPEVTQFAFEAPEGQNTAFSNGGTLSQVLDVVLTANTSYTLRIDVGNRFDLSFAPYTVQLWAGGILLAEEFSLIPGFGLFETSVVTYDALPGDLKLGLSLEIRFGSESPQVNFDNVQLSTTFIPGPASLAIFALAAVGVRRRRYRGPGRLHGR